jgi:hypothetical protein
MTCLLSWLWVGQSRWGLRAECKISFSTVQESGLALEFKDLDFLSCHVLSLLRLNWCIVQLAGSFASRCGGSGIYVGKKRRASMKVRVGAWMLFLLCFMVGLSAHPVWSEDSTGTGAALEAEAEAPGAQSLTEVNKQLTNPVSSFGPCNFSRITIRWTTRTANLHR